jgi:hypothetical protein
LRWILVDSCVAAIEAAGKAEHICQYKAESWAELKDTDRPYLLGMRSGISLCSLCVNLIKGPRATIPWLDKQRQRSAMES